MTIPERNYLLQWHVPSVDICVLLCITGSHIHHHWLPILRLVIPLSLFYVTYPWIVIQAKLKASSFKLWLSAEQWLEYTTKHRTKTEEGEHGCGQRFNWIAFYVLSSLRIIITQWKDVIILGEKEADLPVALQTRGILVPLRVIALRAFIQHYWYSLVVGTGFLVADHAAVLETNKKLLMIRQRDEGDWCHPISFL